MALGFTRKSRNDSSFAVPTLRSVSSTYAKLFDKRTELQERHTALRIQQIELAHSRDRALNDPPVGTERDVRVARLLGKEIPHTVPLGQQYVATIDSMADIAEAISHLDRQIEIERGAASAIIREEVADHHGDIVRNICTKLSELHDLNCEYAGFSDTLNTEGVSWSALGPMHPQMLGSPRDRQGAVARYLRDAERHGFIRASDMPESLRR